MHSQSPPLLIPEHEPLRLSADDFDLRCYWTSLISEIEAELDASVPVRYPERVHRAMRHSVLDGAAKRAPAIMCVASCDLFGGCRSASFPAACALEMVHAASLVHDDLPCMDDAPIRRGRPSTHALFGVDMAVLAGDALFPLAFQHIVARTPSPDVVPAATVLRVLAEISRAVGSTGMAAGQSLDIAAADAAGCEEEVLHLLEKKFGEMAECSAVCGGLLGSASDEEVETLRRYGRSVGVLYKLVDDVLTDSNEGAGKMRSNANAVSVLGKDRALELVEELRLKAKKELEMLEEKYGNKVLPLHSFVDYAVERSFAVKDGDATASNDVDSSANVDGNKG
ncbi:heterodimeric geranylgeranyl pyrophosphate synthase small subunit [Canna indica]|uniref:Heterodimeric geranylgeranyl pyrophosphate synthase small subunit n=1 Tax=Canna indica TaxID=4628 RepID=A0AAQ3L4K7_9LILI|nr:heterodimeric geranylgeranyl pyrophosphate synthase small subunit [Canna indica]